MLVEVDHVTKRYGDKLAVDDLSFTIDQGEVVGFLGPNGAGKSTTMNMITGYLSATEGKITIAGYDILDDPIEAKKHIGYLPELPPLYVDMTVHEYLDFLYELKKCKIPRRQHLQEICEAVRITDVYERVIKNLSKGYRQRGGLAGALIGSPELLILDEPTVGLDPQQIIEIRSLIKDLGSKCTVILSSHILSEIEAVCSRVLVIDHGRLIADDTPSNLSKNLSGDASVHIRVLGDKDRICKILSGLPRVKEVTYNGLKEDAAHEFRVTPEERIDIRADIAKSMVEAGFDVIGLRFAEMTLEEIFLDLIAKEESN